jgi:polysaccharide export outer membrane protein
VRRFNETTFTKKQIPFSFRCLLFSHASKRNMIYYQMLMRRKKNHLRTKLKYNNLLMILVSAKDEIAIPFNLTTANVTSAARPDGMGQQSSQLYLVDARGYIEFPILEPESGLRSEEVLAMLQEGFQSTRSDTKHSHGILNFCSRRLPPGTYSVTSEN